MNDESASGGRPRMTLRRMDPRLSFALFAIAALSVLATLSHSAAFALHPAVFAAAITADLLGVIPLLYYVLVVRTKRAAPFTLLPVFVAGLTAVKLLIPADARGFLQPLLALSMPLEIGSLGLLAYRMYQRRGQIASADALSGDGFERFSRRATALTNGNILIELALTELSVFYYGVCGWFVRPVAPIGEAFTCHRKSGWSAILGVLIFLVIAEGSVVHLALAQWNLYAAWIWNAFDAYLILFLLADYQAMRHRPILLTGTTLLARLGLRWSAEIPLERIATIAPFTLRNAPDKAGYQKIALLGDPEFVLTLTEPIAFSGPLGRKKSVTHIGIRTDDPALFVRLQEIATRQRNAASAG